MQPDTGPDTLLCTEHTLGEPVDLVLEYFVRDLFISDAASPQVSRWETGHLSVV